MAQVLRFSCFALVALGAVFAVAAAVEGVSLMIAGAPSFVVNGDLAGVVGGAALAVLGAFGADALSAEVATARAERGRARRRAAQSASFRRRYGVAR
jgi:hypothetical protein